MHNKNEFRYLKERDIRKSVSWKYVSESGEYTESSLVRLIYAIGKHRLHHFLNGEGLRD